MKRLAVTLLALALLAAPVAAEAQPAGAVPRIGLLETGSLPGRAPLWEAFRQGTREFGYVEDRRVIFEARGANGKPERLAALAAETESRAPTFSTKMETPPIVKPGPRSRRAIDGVLE